MRFEKGGKKGSAKGGFELGSIASKSTHLTNSTTELMIDKHPLLSVLTVPITRSGRS